MIIDMDKVVLVFPGQGAQRKGMGRELLARHASLVRIANDILGYDLLLIVDSDEIDHTHYTQPALFVVNALSCLEWLDSAKKPPDFAAGHSLGEYNALLAAGAFDFETGLGLVAERGRLMAEAGAGRMAAVVGWSAERLQDALEKIDASVIDIANFNSPVQQVIAGHEMEVATAVAKLRAMDARVIELRVSGAFHSRLMQAAADRYDRFLSAFKFRSLDFPVISNVEARPYARGKEADLLTRQIASPVRWTETVTWLLRAGATHFIELGPTPTLAKLIDQIKAQHRQDSQPNVALSNVQHPEKTSAYVSDNSKRRPAANEATDGRAQMLGCAVFRKRYGLRYAYLAGAMYKGIASSRIVIAMAKAGMLGFLGTGGLKLSRIEDDILAIKAAVKPGEAWGVNLLASVERPELEEQTVDLYLKHGVEIVEAAAYTQISRALVRYRVRGLAFRRGGEIEIRHKIIAKVSRPEVARAFLSPPPAEAVAELLHEGDITAEQADAAKRVSMADDLCIESDSGGHTDGGVAIVLLPRMLRLRDEFQALYRYPVAIGIGAAGGIGTPAAIAAAFVLGADFVLTGSINQCTVEAGTSDAVKDLLAGIDVQDVTYAPAGDMFELGAKVQVVRKGTLFPARANRLYGLYQHHDAIESIPKKLLDQLEQKYFGRSIESVWEETSRYYERSDPRVLQAALQSSKKRMALVFRWYFIHTNRMALEGDPDRRHDYQVHCGPAMGAFNGWAAENGLSDWRHRNVDWIALMLLREAALYLDARTLQPTTTTVPAGYAVN